MLRIRSRLAGVAGVVALVVGGAAALSSPVASAATRNGASWAHPYSNPVWYPLRHVSTLDCAGNNPGCSGQSPDFKVDWITGSATPYNRMSVAVYAAGAGIVHIGDIQSHSCVHQRTRDNARGTWLWIDHGGGTVSIYMHLRETSAAKLPVRNGDYVTPLTKLGYTGNTGNLCSAPTHYLDFQIKHNAVWKGHGMLPGRSKVIKTLWACLNGHRVVWPPQLPTDPHPTWHQTPKRTQVPSSGAGCMPTSRPRTPARPSGADLHHGSHQLKLTWKQASAGSHTIRVRAELWQYHPTIHRYTNEPAKMLSGTATHVTFKDLVNNQRCKARVAFYNHSGWSRWTAWRFQTPRRS